MLPQISQLFVSASNHLDWGTLAAATAVFLGTLFTTIFGWFRGKVQFNQKLLEAGSHHPLSRGSATNEANEAIETIIATRELRDRIYLNSHVLEENNHMLRELIDEMRKEHMDTNKLTV